MIEVKVEILRYAQDDRSSLRREGNMSEGQMIPVAETLFTEEFLHDPYPAYRRFLEDGRMHYVDYGGGMLAVFKHAECSSCGPVISRSAA